MTPNLQSTDSTGENPNTASEERGATAVTTCLRKDLLAECETGMVGRNNSLWGHRKAPYYPESRLLSLSSMDSWYSDSSDDDDDPIQVEYLSDVLWTSVEGMDLDSPCDYYDDLWKPNPLLIETKASEESMDCTTPPTERDSQGDRVECLRPLPLKEPLGVVQQSGTCHQSSTTGQLSLSAIIDSNNARRLVKFNDANNQVQFYEPPPMSCHTDLYYSCHQLQKMLDDFNVDKFNEELARAEADDKTEEACSFL